MKKFLSLLILIVPFALSAQKAQIDLPITWNDSTTVDYTVTDFGGNASMLVADPTNASNLVLQSEKTSGAQTWAGTTLSTASGFANAIPFASGSTIIKAIVYAPATGVPVRIKVEDATNATISVETEVLTTVANAWDTLTFDFANEVPATAAINFANTYDKLSIFYDFGTTGATPSNTYYVDDVFFVSGSAGGGGLTKAQIDLPVTWNDSATVDYTVTDFGGNASMLVADPMNAANLVLQSEKTSSAQTWAGTTLSTAAGFANAIPFASGSTIIKAVVYAPATGVPVRMKVEDAANPTISVETEVLTTVANAWDTLTFDFSNEVPATAAINFANTYDKMSIFYDFGTTGATPADIYYLDDVFFDANSSGGGGSGGGASTYCATSAKHLGIAAELSSEILLTIENTNATTMKVTIESVTTDDVDFLLVTNGSGAAIGPQDSSVAGQISRTLTWMTPPANVDLNVLWSKDNFGGNWQLSSTDITVAFNATCAGSGGGGATKAQIDLPITWNDSATVDYTVTDFGGNASMLVADPTNAANLVLQSEKTSSAQTWAGTTLSTAAGFANAIPFASGSTIIKAIVYAPATGVPVRIKVEDSTDPTISVETEVLTTVANAWDTLSFDFANQVPATAAINFANTYDKLSIFYDFGTAGATPANVYYVDDVFFDGGSSGGGGATKAQIDLPISWNDSATVDYTVTDFGGNASMLVADPLDPTNLVMQSEKTSGAQTWAGTTLSTNVGLASAIPFVSGSTIVSAVVYAPATGVPVRIKVEDATDPTVSVETEVLTTVANAWDTLTFDFANQVPATAAIDFTKTYDKMSIFYDFGTTGATPSNTYYVDDVFFGGGSTGGGGGSTKAQIDLPITWNDSANVDYTVTDFGGNASMLVADPVNPSNLVMQSEKTSAAQTWAGTTLSTSVGLATAIPFVSGSTVISAVVYAPATGVPVRMKVEDATDPTISVETEVLTTVANAWDTLTFDFANQAAGTAAIDFTKTYNMMSIFYDFGTAGATPANIYYVDDVFFGGSSSGGGGGSNKAQIDMPITWNDTANVDYTVTDFGGNASMLVADPVNPANLVMQSEKTSAAQTWAGTTLSTPSGLASAIPFASGSTIISAVVYSPLSGVPVRIKVEDATDPTISVETEALTTVANAWDTLTFDFSNQAAGTAAIDFTKTYDMVSIFYNFGTAGATPANIYYVDDIFFGGGSSGGGGGSNKAQIDMPITWNDTANVDYTVTDFGGNASMLVADPLDPTNLVMQSEKTSAAQTWAGTTLSTPAGLASAIPFAAGSTIISAVVYSPLSGVPVRIKVEDATDPTISVETEALTTVANAWDTLTFDFSNQAAGTAAIDFTKTYNMVSIFYNFGTAGATPSNVYYVDDIFFGGSSGGGNPMANVTFQVDLSDYTGTYTEVNLNGTFNGWCGNCAQMLDPDNDSIYDITVSLPANDTIEFKYTLDGWTVDEQLTPGDPCVITAGGFTNRVFLPMADTTLGVVCWESCDACEDIGLDENNWLTSLSISPNPSSGSIAINGSLFTGSDIEIVVSNAQGQMVYQEALYGQYLNQQIDLKHVTSGIYIVSIVTDQGVHSEKLLIRK